MYYDCHFFGTIWADTLFLLPLASITVTLIPPLKSQCIGNDHMSLVTDLELF